jgi:hypothetical protein
MGSALGVLGFLIAAVLVCYFTVWLLRAVGITAPFYVEIFQESGFSVYDERNIEIYENLPKDSFWAKTYRREVEKNREREEDAIEGLKNTVGRVKTLIAESPPQPLRHPSLPTLPLYDEPKEMSEKDSREEAHRKWKEGKP